jgi:CheY-like chemotaxis protein
MSNEIPRVLIVDDQRDIMRLIHASLDSLGHELEIVEAPSGEEALLEATRQRIDLLVSDYRLPGITGVELMSKMRARHPDIKAILITAMTDKHTREEMRLAGATALFDKPIPLADFLDVVERSLGLDRIILPPEEDDEVDAHHKTLSDLLSGFRKENEAQAVLLVSDRGRVLVRAGDLYDSSMEVSLLSALVAIANAGQKAARVLHQDIKDGLSLHTFHGGDQDIIFTSVNSAHALCLAGEKIAAPERLSVLAAGLAELCQDVEKELKSMGVAPLPEVEDDEVQERAASTNVKTQQIEQLLDTKKKLKDVDAFWEKAIETAGNIQLDPDKLTYDQARQLGLTPEDEAAAKKSAKKKK